MHNIKEMKYLDTQNMFDILLNFPEQVCSALQIGDTAPLFKKEILSNDYLILGMGGSAIGGDLLKSYFNSTEGAKHLSIRVNRNYDIPFNINYNTNVIACSYSGGTEETIASLEKVMEKTERIICLTSGGTIGKIADENEFPKITIPGGMQPRCSIGLLFFPLLKVFIRSKTISADASKETNRAINELIELLDTKSKLYSDFSAENNPALAIAKKLNKTAAVIYSSCDRLDSVNLRWRCQIQENAKNLAFGNFLPEMNHNEINAWSYPNDIMKKFSLIFLKDKDDNERVKIRFNALEELLKNSVHQVINIESNAKYLLTRMFDLIYLGDWVSYYMALLNGVDPTPIPLISKLKSLLSEK